MKVVKKNNKWKRVTRSRSQWKTPILNYWSLTFRIVMIYFRKLFLSVRFRRSPGWTPRVGWRIRSLVVTAAWWFGDVLLGFPFLPFWWLRFRGLWRKWFITRRRFGDIVPSFGRSFPASGRFLLFGGSRIVVVSGWRLLLGKRFLSPRTGFDDLILVDVGGCFVKGDRLLVAKGTLSVSPLPS